MQHKNKLESVKTMYEDKLEMQEKDFSKNLGLRIIVLFKQEARKNFEDEKSKKDSVITQNVLQEIRRFETNMQHKGSDKPLTMSELKPERLASSSNLVKIEQISKVEFKFNRIIRNWIQK